MKRCFLDLRMREKLIDAEKNVSFHPKIINVDRYAILFPCAGEIARIHFA